MCARDVECTRTDKRDLLCSLLSSYKSMMTAFHMKVRNNDEKLGDLTENENFWRHHWTTVTPLALQNAPSAASAGSDDVRTELEQLRRQNRSLQSQVDRSRSAAGRNQNNNTDTPRVVSKGAGKGKGKPGKNGNRRERSRNSGGADTYHA